ncbi:hypothetical protein Tco_0494101 [Tanacetum coccineum]
MLSNRHQQNWLSPEQMAYDKDFLNPLIATSLLKTTIWSLNHQYSKKPNAPQSKSWLSKQTALSHGVLPMKHYALSKKMAHAVVVKFVDDAVMRS